MMRYHKVESKAHRRTIHSRDSLLSKYILEKWPPIIDGYLVRSPQSDRISNYFTQYLHYLIYGFVGEHNAYFFLQEVECNKHTRKLDYMVGKGNELQYFQGKIPRRLRWVALIEAQWGNNNEKKKSDYLDIDFPKLIEWEAKYSDQVKIVLLDMTGHSGNWQDNHRDMLASLRVKAKSKDINGRYMVLITTRLLKGKRVGYTVADRWKIIIEKEINYT